MRISIHALHEESDNVGVAQLYVVLISIHALHEESDLPATIRIPYVYNFNPRSP